MMMFGKFRGSRVKRDEHGKTVKKVNGKGKEVAVTEKVWIVHKEENGDTGVYPSVNHIYVHTGKGGRRLSKPAEDLKEKWEALAMMWAHDTGWQMTDKEKVVVELIAHFPDESRERDTNNVFKLMCDAFNEIIYNDDHYALPRVVDFDVVTAGEKPYFELYIYRKDEEYEILQQRLYGQEVSGHERRSCEAVQGNRQVGGAS
jgi:Holliday junction resolvase RusA-like endonuclease